MSASEENKLPYNDKTLKKFFHLKEIGTIDKIEPQCLLCKNKISCYKSTSSNLKKHLEKKHKEEFKDLNKRKLNDDPNPNNAKKSKPEFFKKTANSVTQSEVDGAVLHFMIQGPHPTTIVERPEFRNLINKLQPNKTIMARSTLVKRTKEAAEICRSKLCSTLEKVEHVSTTGDFWSVHHRCFYGSTAHWICENTLQRKFTLLACRRVKGKKDYTTVANVVDGVHRDYAIQNKTVGTTTDNATNFVKAFSSYGQTKLNTIQEEDEDSDANPDDADPEVEFHDLDDILSNPRPAARNGAQDQEISLPPHERCVSHTLNLVASKDSLDAVDKDAEYKNLYESSFKKCRTLWRKQNQSTNCSDDIKEICGVYLPSPTVVRWNSEYDSVKFMLDIEKKNPGCINKCCDKLGILSFRQAEFKFLKEYSDVMKPLSDSLDYLQGEKNAYMGVLLPTLHSLRRTYVNIDEAGVLLYCVPLVEALIAGIDKRFQSKWFRKDLVLAAVTHPMFQLNWIVDDEARRSQARRWLEAEVAFATPRPSEPHPANPPPVSRPSIFDFELPCNTVTYVPNPQNEVERFFSQPSEDLSCLFTLPTIKQLFIKYNTPIPSSAAVERVFSIAGELFTKKRGRLTDSNFENFLLLKFQT